MECELAGFWRAHGGALTGIVFFVGVVLLEAREGLVEFVFDAVMGVVDDVFEDGEDVGEGATDAATGHFVDHVDGVVHEAEGVEFEGVGGRTEFLHGHGEGAEIAQDAGFDEGGEVHDGHAQGFGLFADVFEGMGFDLFCACETDFTAGEVAGEIFFVEGLIDVEVDDEVWGTRAPEAEEEEVAGEVARAQVVDVFGRSVRVKKTTSFSEISGNVRM